VFYRDGCNTVSKRKVHYSQGGVDMKRFPKILVVLLMVTVVLVPMFISCDGETAPPPDLVGEARTAFLNKLKEKIAEVEDDFPGIEIKLTGQNFTVTFDNDVINFDDIKPASVSFYQALKATATSGILTINDDEVTKYNLNNENNDLENLETDVRILLFVGNDPVDEPEFTYGATVEYNGQTFSLGGTVTFVDLPNLQ
jgi:hypothetical protein